MKPQIKAEEIVWFGQATLKIPASGKTIYIDPFQITKTDTADIICITHAHFDHLSIKDIEKVITDSTVLVVPESCVADVGTGFKNRIIAVAPGKTVTQDSITITAVPAYNRVKVKNHPQANKWVGYIISVDGVTVYVTGDTETIPEMKEITADIILLPLGQTYTMNSVEEAVQAVLDVKASIAIPIHFGLYEGTDSDAKKFQDLLQGKVSVFLKKKQ